LTVVFFTDRDLGNRFPEILKANSFAVERHSDHFPPECPDEEWLAEVARRGWVAVTHDARIRYKPNELAAVIRHGVRLVVVVGKAPYPDLARSFVNTRAPIEAFIEETPAPFIAKVYRPRPAELAADPTARGRIERWYPKA
jgi:PIN domain-containing protein